MVLGSGSGAVQIDRACAGYLVEMNAPVLMDLGPGTLRNLARTGLDRRTIAAVLISHLHVDHYADLLPFLFEQSFAPRGPLTVYGPPGTAVAVDHLVSSSPSLSAPWLTVTEVRGPFDVAGARVTPFEVVHSKRLTSLAYRIERHGVLAYSGDSEPCDALVEACRGADLALIEATGPQPRPKHMTDVQARDVARRAGVRRLVLTHLGPDWAGRPPAEAAADLLQF